MNLSPGLLGLWLLAHANDVWGFSSISIQNHPSGRLTRGMALTVAVATQEQSSITKATDDNNDENDTHLVKDKAGVSTKLPTVIQQIADDRREFQMNLGKAMDTLRKDMPEILHQRPDYSIYSQDIRLVDPSGVQLTGIDSYKSAVAFFQTFIGFWFSTKSGLQYRMVYDFARASIRISWNAVLIPKVPLGRPLYVDGVSYYQLDRSTGTIDEHRIERLVINNSAVAPPYGVLSLLQQDVLRMRGTSRVPVGIGTGCYTSPDLLQ